MFAKFTSEIMVFFAARQNPIASVKFERTASASRDSFAKIGILELYDDRVTWNEARKFCIAKGGHLAIIRSRGEANIMAKYHRNTDPDRIPHSGASLGVFVGFHDFYNEGEFVTVRGEPLNETGYSTFTSAWGSQPDNGGVSGQGRRSQQCGGQLMMVNLMIFPAQPSDVSFANSQKIHQLLT
ncbi:hypothetical protein QAD02_015797 [Eretmocerus hayati]|uniref:Uncharacterized protein n=1 Tax=Eretmocerus hayati TaxID=131215 RepID=A0ACC2PE13_9HYME|nr:hypothetical protein QAD02_015797 [Eretmocerus hayati]